MPKAKTPQFEVTGQTGITATELPFFDRGAKIPSDAELEAAAKLVPATPLVEPTDDDLNAIQEEEADNAALAFVEAVVAKGDAAIEPVLLGDAEPRCLTGMRCNTIPTPVEVRIHADPEAAMEEPVAVEIPVDVEIQTTPGAEVEGHAAIIGAAFDGTYSDLDTVVDALANLGSAAETATRSLEDLMAAVPEEPPLLELDDSGEFLVNRETGEMHVYVPEELQANLDPAVVPDEGFIKWLLGKIQLRRARKESAENDLAVVDAKLRELEEDALRAARNQPEYLALADQQARGQSILNKAIKEADKLEAFGHPMCKAFAQHVLKGKKDRTWKSLVGYLSLRKQEPTIKIEDKELAVQLYKALNIPLKVTEEAQVGTGKPFLLGTYIPIDREKLDAETIAELERVQTAIYSFPGAISYVPADEKLEIKTGGLKA